MTTHEEFIELVKVVSQGNPGALTAMGELYINAEKIDPDHKDGKYAPVLMLGRFKLRGGKIWQLYKNVCGESPHRMMVLLRATQLGYITQAELQKLADTPHVFPLTIDEWRTWNSVVCLHVPNFKPLHFVLGI